MGSPEYEPGRYDGKIQHEVTIPQSFYLQIVPVTHGQWRTVHFALGVVYLELDDRGAVLEEDKIVSSLDRELDNQLVRLLEK
jgi:hypothetical protein